MKKLILTTMCLLLTLVGFNAIAGKMSEGDYVDTICKGSIEYTLDDKTRVDCQLPNESQEYDWDRKWYECIGQSLYYGMKTRNTNGCVLIAKSKKWKKYTDRALKTIKHYSLPIKLYIVKPNELSTTLLHDPKETTASTMSGSEYDSSIRYFENILLGNTPFIWE